ncbi:conserved exported hypothetical protein [Candidatus Desulfosporosinus infrequens]|uniref:FeoB-associated Cys-rich membrane protein n=1 Tax=Candidatus Desulfosporosinus infrequens TaxID=2043169 RepID=A0A2U3L6H0_9FIRM|nr:conserved exported hypothetical protein [Candidatus Desulfosporosinus infrequens]
MINWILGGIIFGATVLIVVRAMTRMRKGESSCCGNCTQSKCGCSK